MINPYDRTPPTVHRRPPAPPSKPEVPPAPRPAVAELDAVAGGLDPEQEIRARALDAAVRLDGETTSLEPSLTAYVESGGLAELIDVAGVLAAYIRDGSRP